MTTREFLENELCKILVSEKQARRQEKDSSEEAKTEEEEAKREAEASINYVYDGIGLPMELDPRKFLPSGTTLSVQADTLKRLRKKTERWGNLPDLVEAIQAAEKKLASLPKIFESFFRRKPGDNDWSRVAHDYCLQDMTERLAIYGITRPRFWAAAILSEETDYKMVEIPTKEGEIATPVEIYNDDNAAISDIENAIRQQQERTAAAMLAWAQENDPEATRILREHVGKSLGERRKKPR